MVLCVARCPRELLLGYLLASRTPPRLLPLSLSPPGLLPLQPLASWTLASPPGLLPLQPLASWTLASLGSQVFRSQVVGS